MILAEVDQARAGGDTCRVAAVPAARGTHLLIDLWGAQRLDDLEAVRGALLDAVAICGATLLELKLHGFGDGQGITGVALLAESHISIHSWPEHDYAAIDIFVCGPCDPHSILPVLREAFSPERVEMVEHRRG
ncbi:MAG TPA: adenosylmethionine decarboxylase, partial [Armatimonadota bacterium]|nr:adenosylmethionine decarboxylase [Armatimonadota bacterium]